MANVHVYNINQDAIVVMEKSEPNKNQLKLTCCVCAHMCVVVCLYVPTRLTSNLYRDWRFILKCWRTHVDCNMLCCVVHDAFSHNDQAHIYYCAFYKIRA